MWKNTPQKGFTLIELLVVIAIIGTLASVVLASLNTARSKARDASRIASVKAIITALEANYSDTGTYPLSTGGVANWICSGHANWESGNTATALSTWLPKIPVDPTSNIAGGTGAWPWEAGNYGYCYFRVNPANAGWGGNMYMLIFRLENSNMSLENTDGVYNCNSLFRDYGGNDGYIITWGGSC